MLARVTGRTHRLIGSRYPTVGVFDDLTRNPDDLRVAFLLESATNDRLTPRLALLPDEEIVTGAGASIVMAAFLHADEAGGRFTDGRLGAWYASMEIDTAIAETLHHNERRLRCSADPFPCRIQIRELISEVDCELFDIRGMTQARPELYHPADYSDSQAWGIGLRWPPNGKPEGGIVFDSVRLRSGTNICLYRPTLVGLPVQGDHYEYHWDRNGKATVSRLTNVPTA
jgi:hypothetical protein